MTTDKDMERDEFSTAAGDALFDAIDGGSTATGRDGFSALIRAAAEYGETSSPAATETSPALSAGADRLSDAAWIAEASVRVERRVMVEIARRSLERSRRRVRFAIVVCGAGFVVAMAGVLAALAAWSPVITPGAMGVSWFGQVREWLADLLGGAVEVLSAGAFVERWGLVLLAALGAAGMAGLFYILNRAFSDDYAAD